MDSLQDVGFKEHVGVGEDQNVADCRLGPHVSCVFGLARFIQPDGPESEGSHDARDFHLRAIIDHDHLAGRKGRPGKRSQTAPQSGVAVASRNDNGDVQTSLP